MIAVAASEAISLSPPSEPGMVYEGEVRGQGETPRRSSRLELLAKFARRQSSAAGFRW